jgi:hypothetical protein
VLVFRDYWHIPAKQRETAEAEAKIIYIMVDDSGKVIRQVTPEELRAYK